MVIKRGDNEYMSISYEWEGSGIPGFAMDLMGFMKQNKMEKSGVWEGKEEAYEEFACKTCKKHNSKAAAQKCPDCGKPMDECTCEK
jgi:peptide subunit release factor 1 (eRF1)